MTNKRSYIRILTKNDKTSLEKLRKISYTSHAHAHFRENYWQWSLADDGYLNFGLFLNGRLVSALRLETAMTYEHLRLRLDISRSKIKLLLPALYISQTCTHPRFQKRGFNKILRYWSIVFAERFNCQAIYHDFVYNESQANLFLKMGCKLQAHPVGWSGRWQSQLNVSIAILKNEKFDQAKCYLMSSVDRKLKELAFYNLNRPIRTPNIDYRLLALFQKSSHD